MAEDTSPPPAPKRWPWGRIALIVSLAVNLMVAGLVAGAVLRDGRHDARHDRRPALAELGFGPYVEALDPADRAAMAAGLRRKAGAFSDNRAELRAQFGAILAALRADPFDAQGFARLIEDQQTKLFERQALGRALLLERIESLDPAQRAAYADRIERMLRRAARPLADRGAEDRR